MIIKKINKKKINYLNKKITKRLILFLNNIKIKYFLEIFCGNNYIKNSIIKKNKILSKTTSDKNKKSIKKNIKIKILKKEKNNKYIIKNKIKNLKKYKNNIVVLNPPYLKYKNINLKKIKIKDLISITNFKNKKELKKYIKILKKFLKKKSKIIIELKNEKFDFK